MGGKIRAYNKITKYAEELAQQQHQGGMQEVIMSTDQAYWQVISLVNKKETGGRISETSAATGQRCGKDDCRRSSNQSGRFIRTGKSK